MGVVELARRGRLGRAGLFTQPVEGHVGEFWTTRARGLLDSVVGLVGVRKTQDRLVGRKGRRRDVGRGTGAVGGHGLDWDGEYVSL